ncbi:HD domain-containing phosphohydrolase [Aliivibrio fischeri]|uniref:HD domain-containing phosphohydrolase n=1 Tax=Aliivibrio fischeri TaxID=668 RepID=UPI001F32E3F0|nr:HD domain-containing phosphohydrolase [Aliivibrio fischeri]MCE4936614.1 HD domain-containing protein [Aliivibrio fischeri]
MKRIIKTIRAKLVFPLHVHISTLFILMIAIICTAQILLANKSMNDILLEANSTIFDRIANETRFSMRDEYRPAFNAVEELSQKEIIKTNTLEGRKAYFSELLMLLKLNNHVSTYRITYPNGDWFGVGIIENQSLRKELNAPPSARFYFIDVPLGTKVTSTIYFYDKTSKLIDSLIFKLQKNDPRNEDWFKNSTVHQTILSKPRYFNAVNQFGLTIHQKADNDVVVSADLLMFKVDEVLKSTSNHSSSIRVLYDEESIVYASNYNAHTEINNQAVMLKDIFNQSAMAALQQLHLDQEIQRYQHNNEDWYGKIFSVPINQQRTLNLLVAVKASELLSSASVIRNQTILWSFLVLCLSIPCVYFVSQRISKPIKQATEQARLISKFDFSQLKQSPTKILEIDNLNKSVTSMKSAIENYFNLTNTILEEHEIDDLIQIIGRNTANAAEAAGAYLYLINDDETHIEPHFAWRANTQNEDISGLKRYSLDDKEIAKNLEYILVKKKPFEDLSIQKLDINEQEKLGLKDEDTWSLTFPLFTKGKQTIGAMVLVFDIKNSEAIRNDKFDYFESLINFTAIALHGRKMLQNQKDLLESFIQVMASAIDTKSPYTGNHCQKVPVLTQWLAEVADQSSSPKFKHFTLNNVQKEELRIASWLHDCGKITTPEHVVDKATKLETIYNRIHEIRTRFEVLKRDVEIKQWKEAFKQELPQENKEKLQNEWQKLDDEFTFIAKMNVGDEFLSEKDAAQIQEISQRTWTQTLDSSLGLSWEEKERLNNSDVQQVPLTVNLLQDNLFHLISREMNLPHDKRFTLQPTQYENNLGEIYNLLIQRGTLNNEERFVINNHIIQTIQMLEALPFPKTMKDIAKIAGGHHEKMNGTGYPMGLTSEQMPLTAKMMAIADIFEALTSHDRPYKKAKTLTESLNIMRFMAKDQHIDSDLFDLFLTSGLYKKYADAYLKPEQCDDIDIEKFLS